MEVSAQALLQGRVVDAYGEPLASARVRIFVMWVTDHGVALHGLAMWRETRTDGLGQFSVPTPPARDAVSYLVVERDGMARTVPLARELRPVEVRLAPGRPVPIEVRCRRLFEELDGAPVMTVFWHRPGQASPFDHIWSSRVLPARGTLTPEPPLPGYDLVYRGNDSGARRFAIMATLPPGRSTVTLSAPCGFATRDVEVSENDGGVPPIRFTLPQPDAGALEVSYVGFETAVSYGRSHSVFVWDDDFFSRRIELAPSDSAISRAIPAGTYWLGSDSDPSCKRSIEIRPGAVTRVDVPAGSCMVSILMF